MGSSNFRRRLHSAVGASIADLRQRIRPRLSQTELAARSGVSRAAISAIEAGQQGISLSTLCHVASALAVAPGDLLPNREELALLLADPEARPAEIIVEEYLSRHA